MERITNAQLIDYLLSTNLITKHQHGFLLKHSTCTRAHVQSYNIRGNLLAWITALLQHRTQQVRINDTLSDSVVIISGVLQGSVLGPTLFLLYTSVH